MQEQLPRGRGDAEKIKKTFELCRLAFRPTQQRWLSHQFYLQ